MSKWQRRMLSANLLLMTACATMPTGPSVMALPGTGKSFDNFRGDDSLCRGYAFQQIGGPAAVNAGVDRGVATAAIGTALGAAAGAAIGGGRGAAVGSGVGLAGGSIVGAEAANTTGRNQQERFDNAYIQCMYAQGHKVPVYGTFTDSNSQPAPPPPPPGRPPAPPPEVMQTRPSP